MIVQAARDDLVARLRNGRQLLLRHLFGAQGVVCDRRGLFQDAERVCDLARHDLDADADGEILVAALCLRRPVAVHGDADLAHLILLHAVFHKTVPPVVVFSFP